jgi:methyltransferase
VVAGEIAVLPFALDLPLVAVIFSILNSAVLAIRIRAENRALDASAAMAARAAP